MKTKNHVALVVLVTGASCFFASAASAGKPVQVFALHGAYIDNAMLTSSAANVPGEAKPSIVLPSMVGGSITFRYSAAFNSAYSWATTSV